MQYIQSIIDSLRDCYWNMGPGYEWEARERTGGEGQSWPVPPPWKLYFNPWI